MLRKLPHLALLLVAFFMIPACSGILGDFSVGSSPIDASTDGTIAPQPDAGGSSSGGDANPGDDATIPPGDDSGSTPDSGPSCGPTTCATGCCSGNTCMLGTDPNACGTGGSACGTCGSGQACASGSCTCGGASCTSGCCNASGACVTPSTAACGSNGGVCAPCGPNQECNAHGTCVCDATTCPNGCCDVNQKCVAPPSATACGTGGASCQTCTAGEVCATGVCQCPPPVCSGTSLNACGVVAACSALGCLSTGTPHCEVIVPTAPVTQADVTAPGVTDITIAANAIFDTTTGAITGVRAGGGGVVSGIGFRIASGVGIWTFKSLTIPAGIMVHFTSASTNAAAFVATTTMTINGIIDARGYDASNNLCGAGSPGPAGNPGGKPTDGPGAGAGGGKGTVSGFYSGGPAGGSFGTLGGAGGEGCNAENSPVILTPGAAATSTYGTAALNPNVGGSGGGAGTDTALAGGGGGGAIQLVAGNTLTINGGINAGGCNGHSSTTFSDTGTAGGSGGAILLESPTMTNNGTIAANGGGGGGQTATTEALPGQLSATPAAGAVVNQTGVSNHAGGGGAGAAGSTAAIAGGSVIDLFITGTNGGGAGGGGGGGAGRIRLNNSFGISPGGTISPATSTNAATIGTCTGS